jgi:hypothetical protein
MPQDRRLVSAGRGVRVGFAEGDDLSTGYPQENLTTKILKMQEKFENCHTTVTQLSHNCHKKDRLKH